MTAPSSDRGRVVAPNLDDRTWQDLVTEMRTLIPQYAPGWTDQNQSDLGITLIELFAWLAESVIYRLNRVPEKNYLAFVNLMGITRNPATPARTFLTFTSGKDPVDVPAGTQASTPAQDGESPIVFETDEAVRVLPVAMDHAVVVTAPSGGTASYVDVSASVAGPPTDRYALTVPPAGGTVQLCLGFDAATAEEVRIGLRFYAPVPDTDSSTVTWVYATGSATPTNWTTVPSAAALDGSGRLRHDGLVRLTLPADWAAQRPTALPTPPPADPHDAPNWGGMATTGSPVTDALFWIGLRLTSAAAATTATTVGIERVLFNAASARTALTVRDELVGTSDGSAFQTFRLRNRPLYRRPDPTQPFADTVVQIGTPPAALQTWTLVDDPPAPGDDPAGDTFYWVDPITGEIRFGNRDRTHAGVGSIPPSGATIRATYRYVASGGTGNIAAGKAGSLGPTLSGALPVGISGVINRGPALDGKDEEPVEETLRRAPQQLKIRDRAVTADDYEFLTRQVIGDDAVCRCLPPLIPTGGPATAWQFASMTRTPGTVNVVVVPDQGLTVARPAPTPDLIRDVKSHLDQRRDLTVNLEVLGPRYLPILVTAELRVWAAAVNAGLDQRAVKTDTLRKLATFLHPTHGGPRGNGWLVGQPVFSSDVFQAIMPATDVGYVASLSVGGGSPLYVGGRPFTVGPAGASVQLADYEIVCAADDAAQQPLITVKQDNN